MSSPLERLNALIVDDSQISRALLTSLLRSLGVRNIFQVNDGLAAVEFLRLVADSPQKAGASQIDLVLADLIMPRCDGPTLIRWIRLGPQSPDRFVAVLAISGAPALERVALARDVGANELLGKPFSADSLGAKLVHLVNRPRQFVLAPGYFGPDRRRSTRPFVAERRVIDPAAIQVIHAGDGTRDLPTGKSIIHFRLRNRLLDKVGMGGDIPDFDPALLTQAQGRIRDMAGDYVDWMRSSIALLRFAVEELSDRRGNRYEHLRQIKSVALELGSQGDLFDYPLMTKFGRSLYTVTRDPPTDVNETYLRLLKAHIDGIGSVVSQRIAGDGGEIGREIFMALDMARAKYQLATG